MHRQQHARAWGNRLLDSVGVNVACGGVDIDQHGTRANILNRFDGGAEGQRRGNHLVAVRDVPRCQHEVHRCRAGVDSDGVRRACVLGERLLELLRLRSSGQPATAQHLQHRLLFLLIQRGQRIGEKERIISHGFFTFGIVISVENIGAS
jgi:hypothetical protein